MKGLPDGGAGEETGGGREKKQRLKQQNEERSREWEKDGSTREGSCRQAQQVEDLQANEQAEDLQANAP